MDSEKELDWITRVNSLSIQPLGSRSRSNSATDSASNAAAAAAATSNVAAALEGKIPPTVVEESSSTATQKTAPHNRPQAPSATSTSEVRTWRTEPKEEPLSLRRTNTNTANSSSSMGFALQKIKSTPSFGSSYDRSSQTSSKRSWFSKFKRHDPPPAPASPEPDHHHHFFRRTSTAPVSSSSISPSVSTATADLSSSSRMYRASVASTASTASTASSLSSQHTSDLNPFNASIGVPCKPTISPTVVSGNLTSSPSLSPLQNQKSAANSSVNTTNGTSTPTSTTASHPSSTTPQSSSKPYSSSSGQSDSLWSSHYATDSNTPYTSSGHPVSRESSISPIDSASSATMGQKQSGFIFNTLRKFKSPPSTPTSEEEHDPSLPPRKVFRNHTRHNLSTASSNSSSTGSNVQSSSAHTQSELDEIPLVRVNFALDTFEHDPPQQIPSRKPKPGSVTVNEDTGQIIRPHHSLDAANPNAYNHAAIMAKTSAYNSAVIVANSVRADARRSIAANRMSFSAGKKSPSDRQSSVNNLGSVSGPSSGMDNEMSDEQMASCIAEKGFGSQVTSIDKPLNKKSEFPGSAKNDDDDEGDKDEEEKKRPLTLAEIYTRCCHLREILPIQATLRQLDGKNAPLATLQLMNPRPTMIEVLAFADFLAVAPITALILDNVDMTEEMFKQIILSLIKAENLFKLSLRNVNLTPNNWKLLCTFLAHNNYIIKLDLSLKFPEPGKKKIKYKQSVYTPRESLNWSLLTESLICRGGLEELNINSCFVPHDQFRRLILEGCAVGTKRLGVSCSDLEAEDINVLHEWISSDKTTCQGIDLSGNLLISEHPDFIKALYQNPNLLYLSINSCNLSDPVSFSHVLSESSHNSKLRFLDASYNPKLFPQLSAALFRVLPDMTELVRIYLDYNNLSSNDIILLADAIPKCKSLVHVSLTGNTDINNAAAEALAVAVKLSDTVTLVNVDPNILPVSIARRMTHYCMQNMEELVDVKPSEVEKDEKYNFEGEAELLDDGTELVNAVNYVVKANQGETTAPQTSATAAENVSTDVVTDSAKKAPVEPNSCLLAADGLAKRAKRVREKVQQRLRYLIENYKLREMPDNVRDKLIRLWYLDKTLEGVVENYEKSSAQYKPEASEKSDQISIEDENDSEMSKILQEKNLGASDDRSDISVLIGDNESTNISKFQSPFNFAVSSHLHSREGDSKKSGSKSQLASNQEDSMFDVESDSDSSETETEDNGEKKRRKSHLSQNEKQQILSQNTKFNSSLSPVVDAADAPSLYRECSPLDGEECYSAGEGESKDDYGVCVLPRQRASSTSMHARAQEREEGNFHKMGIMFRRKQLLSGDSDAIDQQELSSDDTLSVPGDEGPNSQTREPSPGRRNTVLYDEAIAAAAKNGPLDQKDPGGLVSSALNLTGHELRRVYHYELANNANSIEEVLNKVKQMSPTDFEKYFLNIDRMVMEQEKQKAAIVIAQAAAKAAHKNAKGSAASSESSSLSSSS